MKESVTKFDFESAFKALDEIDIPVADRGIKANRPALTEIFSRKSKFDSLFEEYYDIGSTEELGEAQEAREAEVAKAKLARIEKIVDLDADSPEDLLTSYVGKYIMQCPQCMTLFYKNKEDIVEAEDDPDTVNVGEVCQHCGNESGYTLVGKVDEAEAEEAADFSTETEIPEEPVMEEEPTEEATEETSGEGEDLDFDLDAINLEDEPVEEEKTEESFVAHTGETLVEEVQDDKDLDAKLEAHSEYIEYLRTAIAQEEAALEKADNEQIKVAIQRNIDAFKVDLENALPEAVKNDEAVVEEPVEEVSVEEVEEPVEDTVIEEDLTNVSDEETKMSSETDEKNQKVEECADKSLTEALHEDTDLDVSAEEFEELINSPEFKKPVSDAAVRAMLDSDNAEEEKENVKESKCEEALEEGVFDGIKKIAGKAKDGLTKFIDTKLKSRAPTADWILNNALIDYTKATLNNDGNAETTDDNKKFDTFAVYYFTNKLSDGTEISAAPDPNSEGLVKGREPELKTKYADAEKIAQGWSKIAGNGPAMIFMVKKGSESTAAFLCQFFNGELDKKSDQFTKYLEIVKNGLAGGKDMAKGGAGQPEVKKVPASKVTKGMQVKLNDKDTGEVVEVTNGRLGLKITFKFADGTTEPMSVAANHEFNVLSNTAPTATESLDTVMANVEELNESILEKLISDSLVEAYKNVAGYRLTSCDYLNEKLNVNGTIYFTSGNTRKTTYTFSEAFVEQDVVEFRGLNEKLGLDKQFTLTGRIDNKTLITESFSNK